MSDYRSAGLTHQPAFASALPDPLPAAALSSVRSRRMVALCLDLMIVGTLALLLWLGLGVLTLGLTLFIVPLPFAIVGFFYNGLTVSGWRMATPGMRIMDLEMRLNDGASVPFLHAAVHAVLFYVSWFFPFVLLWSVIDYRKRCPHDIFAGVVVLRRPH